MPRNISHFHILCQKTNKTHNSSETKSFSILRKKNWSIMFSMIEYLSTLRAIGEVAMLRKAHATFSALLQQRSKSSFSYREYLDNYLNGFCLIFFCFIYWFTNEIRLGFARFIALVVVVFFFVIAFPRMLISSVRCCTQYYTRYTW